MRDISAEVGMQAGSVYYHFKSKEELLLAVYAMAVDGIETRLLEALKGIEDPWQRLEIAVVTHLETILDRDDYSSVMIGVTPDKAEDIMTVQNQMSDIHADPKIQFVNDIFN